MGGIAAERVTPWLVENVPGALPPFEFDLVPGGRSNLTFIVTGADGGKFVLRRPPLSHVLATAHDMGREHRILAALQPTAVPTPAVYAFCEDLAVNDAPFYVMEFVDGNIMRDNKAGAQLSEDVRRHASASLIDVLATLHGIDPDDVGLGQLGRKTGYVERQLKRWFSQFEQSRTREMPDVEAAHARLSAAIPDAGPAAIAHGDYRLDNCICAADGSIAAVLDWELCTLGDALADLGMLLICWTETGDRFAARPDSPTSLPGFLSRPEVIDRYAAASGRDVADIDYYRALAYWKLACISEGVYARYASGAMGEQPDVQPSGMSSAAPQLAAAALRVLDGDA
jgi:aminoglycoside phosphotransferase (APT) family kinase protein